MTDRFVQEFNPPLSDVTICGSMTHREQLVDIADKLQAAGLTVATPDLSEKSDWSSLSPEETAKKKGWLIRRHFANIANAKVVLVCNFDKNGSKNYIGSNSFLEMGAAFIYGKPLYVLNPIPQQNNREELLALEPIELLGDLTQLIAAVRGVSV